MLTGGWPWLVRCWPGCGKWPDPQAPLPPQCGLLGQFGGELQLRQVDQPRERGYHLPYDPGAISTVLASLPGFTGSRGVWVHQSFDLSAYAGESALFRFLYITDWATTESGFYVDEVVIADDGGLPFSDGFEGGSGNWTLDGWQHTTGLAENDWEFTFLNPVYAKGKFTGYEIVDDNLFLSGDYWFDFTTLDTLDLNRDEVTIVVSNHLPEETSFPASYRLLVEKGDAS